MESVRHIYLKDVAKTAQKRLYFFNRIYFRKKSNYLSVRYYLLLFQPKTE